MEETNMDFLNEIGVITIAGQKIRDGGHRNFSDVAWSLYTVKLAQQGWGINSNNACAILPYDYKNDVRDEMIINIDSKYYKFSTKNIQTRKIKIPNGGCWNINDMKKIFDELVKRFSCRTLIIFMFGHGDEKKFGGGLNILNKNFAEVLNYINCNNIVVIADTCHAECIISTIIEKNPNKEIIGVYASNKEQFAYYEREFGGEHHLIAGSIFSSTYTQKIFTTPGTTFKRLIENQKLVYIKKVKELLEVVDDDVITPGVVPEYLDPTISEIVGIKKFNSIKGILIQISEEEALKIAYNDEDKSNKQNDSKNDWHIPVKLKQINEEEQNIDKAVEEKVIDDITYPTNYDCKSEYIPEAFQVGE